MRTRPKIHQGGTNIMTTSVDNVAFDMNNITPNKRKRDALCGKENQIYGHTGYMEVKSLADLMPAKLTSNNNAFEIARKPPKKKTKLDRAPAEPQCFDNAALNLNGPDHAINPFEIKRAPPLDAGREPARQCCFVNPALNIRGPEKEVRNPFEIVRQNSMMPATAGTSGHDNAALRVNSPQVRRAIALNFTPTIGCRINFADVPLESLTPCSMLAKKLVFSPAQPSSTSHSYQYNATPKKSNDECELSAISEKSLDIIAELDCYQLELENSINEAKIVQRATRRSSGSSCAGRGKNLMDIKNRKSFASMLAQAEEGAASDDANESVNDSTVDLSSKLTPKLNVATLLPNMMNTDAVEVIANRDNSGVDYEEIDEAFDADAAEQPDSPDEDEDDFQFKNPAPFVRTFKRKSIHRPSKTVVDAPAVSGRPDDESEKSEKTGIRHSIRNSIRRLIKSQPKKAASADNVHMADAEAMPAPPAPSTVFTALRQSLRRKPRQADMPERCDHEMSIVCDTERKVFRQQPRSSTLSNKVMSTQSHEDLGDQRKPSLRSSFRNTTKDVRRQVMKSMFKKNVEEYQFD